MDIKTNNNFPFGIIMNIEITGAIYCWENRGDRKI